MMADYVALDNAVWIVGIRLVGVSSCSLHKILDAYLIISDFVT